MTLQKTHGIHEGLIRADDLLKPEKRIDYVPTICEE